MARGKKKETLTPEERLQAALVPASEQPYPVPENWCWTYLGCVSDVVTGGTPSKKHPEYYGGLFPFFKPTDLDFGRHVVEASEYLTNEGKIVSRIIPEQSTAVCCIGSIGKCGFLEVEGTTNQQINAAIPKFNPLFLYYYCNTHYFNEELWSKASATTISIVNKSKMESCVFPLPPLPEQQRIVNRIESLFAKLDEAKQKAQDALDSFEPRKAAIRHKAFTGELTAQWRKEHGVGMESWEARTSTQLFEYVTSGSRGWAKYYADNGDIFVRMGNLNHGTIELDLSDIQYVNLPGQTEGQRTKLQKNDILISITADIGMVGIVREMEQNAYINQHIALARPTAKDNAEFLAWYLISDVGLQQMRNKQRGATKIGLGLDDIRSLELLIPTREEQDEVVYILDNLLANEQQAKEAAEGVLEQIDLIKKAILARAFRGELGTNDPSEESAVELVKRVLAVEPPPKARAKAVSIPREVEEQLKCELERKIMKLYYYSDSQSLPINTLMEVSSKKFEVLESIRNLEQRGIIKKLPNGNYKLVR